MRIVCPKCGTEYFIDPDILGSQGTDVQCSACEASFKALPPTPPKPPAPDPKPAAAPSTFAENPNHKIYLRQGDRTYKVSNLATLQRWVVEKRVLPTDAISHDGKKWFGVLEQEELSPFFALIDRLKTARKAVEERTQDGGPPSIEVIAQVEVETAGGEDSFHDEEASSPNSDEHSPDDSPATEGEAPESPGETRPQVGAIPHSASINRPAFADDDLAGESVGPSSVADISSPSLDGFSAQEAEELTQSLAETELVESIADTESPVLETLEDLPQNTSSEADEPEEPEPETTEDLEPKTTEEPEPIQIPEGATDSMFATGTFDVPAISQELPPEEEPTQFEPGKLEEGEENDEDEDASSLGSEEPTQFDPGPASAPPDGENEGDPYAETAEDDPYAEAAGDDPYAEAAGDDPYAEAAGDDPYAEATDDPYAEATDDPYRGSSDGYGEEEQGELAQPLSRTSAFDNLDQDGFDEDEFFNQLPKGQAPFKKRSFKWAAAAIVLLLGGGGGWWFILGPGSKPAGIPPELAGTVEEDAVASNDASPSAASPTPRPTVEGTSPRSANLPEGVIEAEPPEPEPEVEVSWELREATQAKKSSKKKKKKKKIKAPPKPKATINHVALGDQAMDVGDFEGAAEHFQTALRADPRNFHAALQLGWSSIEVGQSSNAIAGFSKALKLRSASAEAHYGLGLAYQGQGRVEQAVAEYQKVLSLDPDGRDSAEVRALLRQLN